MKFVVLVMTLSLVAVASPAGQPTTHESVAAVDKNGLQVTLVLDQRTFARNVPPRFSVRFKNVSDRPVSLKDADDCGQWVIRLEDVASNMPWRLQGLSTDQPEPARRTKELGPGEAVEVSTEWGSNRFPYRYESELVLNLPIPPVQSLRPGRYRLWLGINLKRNPERQGAQMAFLGDFNLGPVEIEISGKDDPAGVQMSEPVIEKNAEFQTVARPHWLIPVIGATSEVQLGLNVTNRTGRSMQINGFDTVRAVLTDAHGTELQLMQQRGRTIVPEPLVLTSRESRTLYRNATLEWSDDGKTLRLGGSDGAGGNWYFDGLKPGRYSVHFVFENGEGMLRPVLGRPAKHAIDPNEAPFWMGKVITKDVVVEVADERMKAVPAPARKMVGGLTSLKGWELYVWRDEDETLYSLLVGTNRNKSADEIDKEAVRGFEAVKAKLDDLKAGQWVTVSGRREGDRPPKDAADKLADYCKRIGLKVQ